MKLYLLIIWGDVEPQIIGPYKDSTERFETARQLRKNHGDNHGIYTLDSATLPTIGAYAGGTLE